MKKKKSKLKAFQGHFLLLIKINERGCEDLPEVFRQMLCCSFFLPGAGCFSVTQGIMPTAQLQHSASFVSLSSLTASSAHTHCSKSIAPPPFLSSFPLLSLFLSVQLNPSTLISSAEDEMVRSQVLPK